MYKILITKEVTSVYNDNNKDGIDNKDMVGLLINKEGIRDIIDLLPIRQYYINIGTEKEKLITKEEALIAYDVMIEYFDKPKTK